MMGYNYERARERLLVHSPLPKRNDEMPVDSFTFRLYQADRDGNPPPLDPLSRKSLNPTPLQENGRRRRGRNNRELFRRKQGDNRGKDAQGS